MRFGLDGLDNASCVKLLVFCFVFFGFLSVVSASTPGNISSCQTLDSAGNYFLNISLQNENVSITGCFNITASNVLIDCQNYFIKNTTLEVPGIYTQDMNNITIQNCNITMSPSANGRGVYFYNVTNSRLINITTNENYDGIWVELGSNNSLLSLVSNFNLEEAIFINSSSNNSINNSIVNNNSFSGIHLLNSNGTIISNITSNNNSQYGLFLDSSSNNTLFGMEIFNSNSAGVFIQGGSSNILSNLNINNVYGVAGKGISISDSNSGPGGYLVNSVINGTTDYGVYLLNLQSERVINVSVYNTTGFAIDGSNDFFIAVSKVIDTFSGFGIYASSSSNNVLYLNFVNNTYSDGYRGMEIASGSNNTLANNTILNSNSTDLQFDLLASNSSLCGNVYGSIFDDSLLGVTNLTNCPTYNLTAISNYLYIQYENSSSSQIIINNPPSLNSGGGGGGGGGEVSSPTYVLSTSEFNEGISRSLSVNARFKINIGEDHYIKLAELDLTSATVDISSKLQEAILSIGETKNFDVNEDGKYDLSITLQNIGVLNNVAKNATFMVKKYVEKISNVNFENNVTDEMAQNESNGQPITNKGLQTNYLGVFILYGAIIIVILAASYLVWRGKHRVSMGHSHYLTLKHHIV